MPFQLFGANYHEPSGRNLQDLDRSNSQVLYVGTALALREGETSSFLGSVGCLEV